MAQQQQDNINISFGLQGMERQSFRHHLDEKVFTFQYNGNLETDEEGIGMTNEHSNILCQKFNKDINGQDYVVIGTKYDSLNNTAYFFITSKNKTPRYDAQGKLLGEFRDSKITKIQFNTIISSLEDIEVECGCDFSSKLNTPLEDQTQIPHCNMEVVLEDSCNHCLNFDPSYPIFDIVLKQEKCGFTMTFSDDNNPPRYVILDNMEPYYYTGSKVCGQDETIPTCLDCEKLRVFPRYTIPCLQPVVIQNGGRLKRGKYEFLIAYSDKTGRELSPYFSLTYPISIFDTNEIVMDQTNLADVTTLGIRLEVKNLDKRFNYYKIAVIENADVNANITPVIEGLHNITDTVVLYTSNETDQNSRTTIQHIFADRPIYKTWRGVITANNYLVANGYTKEKEWNLQPIANLLGAFAEWQTVEANEDLYADGVNDSLYTGYMRDEVYPFGIRFLTDEGYITPLYPLIPRPATDDEVEDISMSGNMSVESILSYTPKCGESKRKYKWQFFNTATILPNTICSDDTIDDYVIVEDTTEESCVIKDIATYPTATFDVKIENNFNSLKSYVGLYNDEICDTSSPMYNSELCSYINPDIYQDVTCVPTTPFPVSNAPVESCTEPVKIPDSEKVFIQSYTKEEKLFTEKTLSEYKKSAPPKSCDNFKKDANGNKVPYQIYDWYVGIGYRRNEDFIQNTDCQNPDSLPLNDIYLNTIMVQDRSTLLYNEYPVMGVTMPNGDVFPDRLMKNARWYILEKPTEDDKVIIEFTKNSKLCETDEHTNAGSLRYTIYKDCESFNVLQTGIIDVTVGGLIEVPSNLFTNSDSIYMVIDGSITEHSSTGNTFYISQAFCGCINIKYRPIEYSKVTVTVENLKLSKSVEYTTTCKIKYKKPSNCKPAYHKRGLFGYWESENIYPDNEDLYNTTKYITHIPDNIYSKIGNTLSEYYIENVNNGIIEWKTDSTNKPLSNITCRPIRHYKFPANTLIPFMHNVVNPKYAESKIYPIGVKINTQVINAFLDLAVVNGLITQQQRNSVTNYEIFRGDRSIHKSILMKGIANDMIKDPVHTRLTKTPTYFRNFPYNNLGENPLLTTDESRNVLLDHPYSGDNNNRFSIISPDIYHHRPKGFTEITVDGYMYGYCDNHFQPVDKHSSWVILGDKAENLARVYSDAEILFETALNVAQLKVQAVSNLGFGLYTTAVGSGMAMVFASVFLAAQLEANGVYKKNKYRAQWLQSFEDLGTPVNFASMQVSTKGWYNYFLTNTVEDNVLRGIDHYTYLKPGIAMFKETEGNVRINNRDREDSLYISTGSYFIEYPDKYKDYDNYTKNPKSSSATKSSDVQCKDTAPDGRIASAYITLKSYTPNQYGDIDSIKWLSINHCGRLDKTNCEPLFGGDIKISRVDLKNKFPFFNATAYGMADRVPFNYGIYQNVAFPRYYIGYKSKVDTIGRGSMPWMDTTMKADCYTEGKYIMYEDNPSKFYLYSYGVPYFLVESEINCNYRYAGREPHERFASMGLDVLDWVQEKNTGIKFQNIFKYNNIYSKNQTGLPYRILTGLYDKEFWDCQADSRNGVLWSGQDNSEVSLNDPWLSFKTFDIYEFPKNYGNLIALSSIESQQVLARFENNAAIFNAVDVLRDRITPQSEELGTGGFFASRPIQFNHTPYGDGGTQHRAIVSCEFGHFWVNAKLGKVYQVNPNGQGLTSISDFKQGGGGESGMRRWFKNNLPFNILKGKVSNMTMDDVDNPYGGIGILMWWDAKFKRVFITKRDIEVRKEWIGKLVYNNKNFYVVGTNEKVEITNKTYFKDTSWTVAYSPIYQAWVSYYGFLPDYALGYNEFFQTGVNSPINNLHETGLWSHLLTNKSFQVFYGHRQPWIIEYPIKNNYANAILQDLKIWAVSQRYHNELDYAIWKKKTFNKLTIYNQTNNSGELLLDYVENYNKANYPKKGNYSYQQRIPVTHEDEQIKINYFYNRVKKEEAHLPIWLNDRNEILKDLNSQGISFTSKSVLERLRGDWFLVRLTQDESSQFKHYFKWSTNKEKFY